MVPPAERLRLPPTALAVLLREARRAYPGECCGFLLGLPEPGTTRVRRLRPAANRAARADRYLIEAREVWRALTAARREGLEVLGVYHSHPEGDGRPSAADRAAAWGGWLYLIVPCSGGTPQAPRCWRWRPSGFVPVAVELEEARPGAARQEGP